MQISTLMDIVLYHIVTSTAPQCVVTFSWLRGLSFLTIRRAMSAGTQVPGRVTQAEQAEGEEPDQDQHRRSDGTLNRGPVYLGALPLCTLRTQTYPQGEVFWSKFPAPGIPLSYPFSYLFSSLMTSSC